MMCVTDVHAAFRSFFGREPESIKKISGGHVNRSFIAECGEERIILQCLDRELFGSRLDAVYGSIPGTPHKPDPYWVNRALADLGADKTEVLYVGDSGVDMQTAANSGLDSAGVLWGFRDRDELVENGAVYICSKPSEITDIVKCS